MTEAVTRLNQLIEDDARAEFARCCGASNWAKNMAKNRPYADLESIKSQSETVLEILTETDWREAFAHHPKIGDKASLREKFAETRVWGSNEQAGTDDATEEILDDLAAGNAAYEAKFGFIFIVCATGKTAAEMLNLLQNRLLNSINDELKIAAEEQKKITRLRLEKWLAPVQSPITTHVLDTMHGVPASGLFVTLERLSDGMTASGRTDGDGRLHEFSPPLPALEPGMYRLTFATQSYFDALGVSAFFPSVAVTFSVTASRSHFHVPLLLSPFGYSTYRGS